MAKSKKVQAVLPPRPAIVVLAEGEIVVAVEVTDALVRPLGDGLTVTTDLTISPPTGMVARAIDTVGLASAVGEGWQLQPPTHLCKLQTPTQFGDGRGLWLPRNSLVLVAPEAPEQNEGGEA